MELPKVVLAFKLLDASKISHRDCQHVLTGVDSSQKESLFAQMKTSLRKFHGEQSMSTSASAKGCSNKSIKLEPGSEVLYSRDNDNFRKRQYGSFNKWRGRNLNSRGRQSSYSKNWKERSEELKHDVIPKDPKQQSERTVNPKGSNGIPLRCKICDSILHLFKDCPHR